MAEKYFDLFVGVTLAPLWKKPPKDAREVRQRADLTEELLKISNRLAQLLKEEVFRQRRAD